MEEQNTQREPIVEHLDKYYAWEYGDFAIKKTRFGLYTSYDRELVELITGGTYEATLGIFYYGTPKMEASEGYVAPAGTWKK